MVMGDAKEVYLSPIRKREIYRLLGIRNKHPRNYLPPLNIKKSFMKKALLGFALLTFAHDASSQVGITGGLNIAKYSYVSDRGSIFSFNAGLIYRKQLSRSVYWQPALSYTGKGATVYPPIPIGSTNPNEKYLNRLGFVELSAPFLAGAAMGDAFRFEIGAGPYLGYLVSAVQTARQYNGGETKYKFSVGGNGKDFTPFDAGLQFSTGFLMGGRVAFHINYDLGMVNVNGTSGAPALKMRSTSMNFTYYFKKKTSGRQWTRSKN
jgi:hypothetical protein